MNKLGRLVRVRSVQPLDGFRVRLVFENDVERELDLERYLHGPIFEPICDDPAIFQAMRVEGGTIVWENGADIDPDVLDDSLEPAWMTETERLDA